MFHRMINTCESIVIPLESAQCAAAVLLLQPTERTAEHALLHTKPTLSQSAALRIDRSLVQLSPLPLRVAACNQRRRARGYQYGELSFPPDSTSSLADSILANKEPKHSHIVSPQRSDR